LACIKLHGIITETKNGFASCIADTYKPTLSTY